LESLGLYKAKHPKKKLCFHAWWVVGDFPWWFELSKNDTYEETLHILKDVGT
jgi:hypothetical protein